MKSFYTEGNKITFKGIRGTITKITETYRKNVIVVKVQHVPPYLKNEYRGVNSIGLFEHPDGKLEYMTVVD